MPKQTDRSGWDDFHRPIPHDALASGTPRAVRAPTRRAQTTNQQTARWAIAAAILTAANIIALWAYVTAKG